MSSLACQTMSARCAERTNYALRWTVSLACCWAMRWVRNSDRPATQVGAPQQTRAAHGALTHPTTPRIKAATR